MEIEKNTTALQQYTEDDSSHILSTRLRLGIWGCVVAVI